MNLVKTLVLMGLLGACASCVKKKEPPDPVSVAKSNFSRMFTLSNGMMVPLNDSSCEGSAFKAKDGIDYVECRAQLQGYVHYEIRFCPTKVGMSCELTRPE